MRLAAFLAALLSVASLMAVSCPSLGRQYISYSLSQSQVTLAMANGFVPWMSSTRPVKVFTQDSISLVSKKLPLYRYCPGRTAKIFPPLPSRARRFKI